MKHILLTNFVMLAVCAFGADVMVGTNEVDLAFEGGALSQTEKTLIVRDIQLILSTGGKYEMIQYDIDEKHAPGMKGRINVGQKGHHWPRAIWENDFGQYRIDDERAKMELVVPEKMVDAYLDAIGFMNSHPKVFAQLDNFMNEINKGYRPEIMDIIEKKALFWFPPGMPAWSKDKQYDDNLREMGTISFSHPSLLTFQESHIGSNTVIYCKSVVRSKKDDSFDQMTLVYDGMRWRIGAF